MSFDREVFKNALRLAGFAIVPIEPTQKMIEAARKEDTNGTHITYATSYEHWDAMIAAYEKEMGDAKD